MNRIIFIKCLLVASATVWGQDPISILEQVDRNLSADSRVIESTMIIKGKRNSRTMTTISYTTGTTQSFSEYLSPARDKGTKMLKLGDELWMYSPGTDRTILISGHLLRQSVMGSDLSYEDMMDDRKLTESYTPKLQGMETIDGTPCYHLLLEAKVDDVAYHSQQMWVDSEKLIPLRQELYAKSGQLLKRITFSAITQVDGRWFPMQMNYKDVMKDGDGTDWLITSIKFNTAIPEHIFSKASLKQ